MVSPQYSDLMGDFQASIHEVSSRLAAMGHRVTLLAKDQHRQLFDVEGRLARHSSRGGSPLQSGDSASSSIYRRIYAGDYDLVHVQGCDTIAAPLGILAALRKRIPFVITFHSRSHSSLLKNALRAIQWKSLRPLVRKAAVHVGLSEYEADFFSREMQVPRSKFVVIPHGMDLPPRSAIESVKAGRLIVSVGRLDRNKGQIKAIEAMHKLQWRFPEARLHLLGEGPHGGDVLKQIRKLRLGPKVAIERTAASDRQSRATLLSLADLVVVLSDFESDSTTATEALALGRKVLANDAPGFKELAQRGLVRTISSRKAPIEIAEAMVDALAAPAPRPEYTLPSWDDCAGMLDDVYTRVTRLA